jgi:trk system potassium uptake protein TrkA
MEALLPITIVLLSPLAGAGLLQRAKGKSSTVRVVIVGAGEAGIHLARMLSKDHHDVVVIDQDAALVDRLAEQLDALVLHGNGASPRMLKEATIQNAEMLVAVTDHDETNITACLAARHHGVGRTAARIHNPDYISQEPSAENILGIDFVIHTEQVVAQKIKAALLVPGAVNVENFAGGRIEVAEVIVQAESPAAGCAVRDIGMPERSLIIGGVRHGETLMSRGDTVLEAGDHIFVISARERIREAVGSVAVDTEPVTEAMMLGGGRAGLRVVEALEETDISIKVIEKDASRAEYLASRLEKGTVLHQRDISRDFLVREGIEHTDTFIALTGDDRTNLMASMYAKELGVRQTICGVARGEYIPLAESLGVDITISGRLLAASVISQFVRKVDVMAVTLLESGAQMIELAVAEDSRVTGHSLAELDFPKEAIVGMLLRDDETIIPHGSDVLQPGDDVVIFTTDAAVEKVERFFAPQ